MSFFSFVLTLGNPRRERNFWGPWSKGLAWRPSKCLRGDPVSAWIKGLQTNVTSGLISTSALLVGRGSTSLKYYRSSSELKSSWAHLFRVLKASPLCLLLVMYKISMDSETSLATVCICNFWENIFRTSLCFRAMKEFHPIPLSSSGYLKIWTGWKKWSHLFFLLQESFSIENISFISLSPSQLKVH